MTDGVEEEEARGRGSLDQHEDAGCDDGQEADDVHDADDVEDDVAWTGQGLIGECHSPCWDGEIDVPVMISSGLLRQWRVFHLQIEGIDSQKHSSMQQADRQMLGVSEGWKLSL